jgi:hypothetical protein
MMGTERNIPGSSTNTRSGRETPPEECFQKKPMMISMIFGGYVRISFISYMNGCVRIMMNLWIYCSHRQNS